MIFVRLSKWQVPQDGSVMRLQSQWVDVLGAPVWSVNTFIDCSLQAEWQTGTACLYSLNRYWMPMKGSSGMSLVHFAGTVILLTFFLNTKDQRHGRASMYCYACTLSLRESLQNFFLKVSKSINILNGDDAHKHCIWLQGRPRRVLGLFTPHRIWLSIFKHFLILQWEKKHSIVIGLKYRNPKFSH